MEHVFQTVMCPKDQVTEIDQQFRIQTPEGIRKANLKIKWRIKDYVVDAQVVSYRADLIKRQKPNCEYYANFPPETLS